MLSERLKKLGKSERKYRIIFERSRDAIFITGPDTKITDINQAGVNILGYENKEEVLALKSAYDLFQSRKYLRRFQKKVAQEGFVTEFETRLMGKGGRIFDALVTSNIIEDAEEETANYVFIIRDITKIKQAQDQIEKRNIRLAALNAISVTVSSSLDLNEVLHSTIDKILEILEPDSVRIYLFDNEKELLNLAAHKGLSNKFVKKSHMRCRKVGDGLLGQTVLTGKTRFVDNFQRSGDPYVDSFIEEGLNSTLYIPLISKGNPLGVMCVSSHNKYRFSADYLAFLMAIGNQIGMAVDNANLYGSIIKTYQKLKDAQEQVVRTEKLASLGKLAATIAHEINNPLAAVLTYIRLMMKLVIRKRFTRDRLQDISRYLDTMESETARCGEIVKNLLAFSRQSEISMGTHNIEEIIERSLNLITHELDIREVQVEKVIDSGLPEILCDFRQIQHAFLNLISNASESMSRGGILTVSARQSKSIGFLDIVISDTGYGIAEEEMKNIFEPFYTTKEEGKGVGLGLSVVYGIITKHNGFIEAESEPGKGSSFRVQLPIAPED